MRFLLWQLDERTEQDTAAELAQLSAAFGEPLRARIAHELDALPPATARRVQTLLHSEPDRGVPGNGMLQGITSKVSAPPGGAPGGALLTVALDHLGATGAAALTPANLANFFTSFLRDPRGDEPALEERERWQLIHAVRERVGAETLAQALQQALPRLPMRPGKTLGAALRDLGHEGLASVELARALLDHFGVGSPTPQDVAALLAELLREEHGYGPPVTDYRVLTAALAAAAPRDFAWADAVRLLDEQEQLALTPGPALGTALAEVLRTAPQGEALPGLWGMWPHSPLRQLHLLYSLVVLDNETFSFASLPTRRVLALEDVAGAPAPVEAQAHKAVGSTWNALDLIDTLMQLACGSTASGDSIEVGKVVTSILERGIKTNAECVLLGLVQLPQPTNVVQLELTTKLLIMFLAGRAHYQLVFWCVWQKNPKLLLDSFLHLYNENPLNLTRLVDVAQELGILPRLVEMHPLAFALDVAALASRQDMFDLERWLQQQLQQPGDGGSEMITATLEFLETKTKDDLLRRDPQAEPGFVPLSVQTVATMLRVLRANGDSMRPEQIDHFKMVRNLCLQLHPRLMCLTPGGEGAPAEPGLAVATFSTDVHRDADNYFRQMYEEKLSVDEIILLLQRSKHAEDPHDRQLFACMVHTLFDEYRWFELYYPPRELLMTAVVFGALIQHQLVDSIPLGIAIRYVLDALRSPPESNMFHFGVQALLRFQNRLAEWPQLCHALLSLPHLQQAHPELGAMVQHALVLGEQANARKAEEAAGFTAIAPSAPDAGAQREPDEQASDQILFLVNNLTMANVDSKLATARELVAPHLFAWFARYLVRERVASEPNNHELYVHLLDGLEQRGVYDHVLFETLVRLKELLDADKTMHSTSERSLLKNLAAWLGLVTLARNVPVRHDHLAFTDLLLQGYERGRLIVTIPFVCKVLEQGARSRVFHAPNPWLMAVLRLLVELYHYAELKLNLKFEIEVLCKSLRVDLQALEPSALLPSRRIVAAAGGYAGAKTLEQGVEKLSLAGGEASTTVPAAAGAAPAGYAEAEQRRAAAGAGLAETVATMLQNLAPYIVVNPQLVPFANNAAWKRVLFVAIERSIREIIAPVVERSVTIASISTRELVGKDFAMEADEHKLRKAAHQMAQSMAGSLALVTCKEPLHMSLLSHARTLFAAGGVTEQQLPEQALLLLVQDNMDLACSVIERTAMDKALAKVDEGLAAAYVLRREFAAHGRGSVFWDSTAISQYSTTLPDLLGIAPPGLQPAQLRVYDDLGMANAIPHAGAPLSELERAAPPEAPAPEELGALTPNRALERFALLAADIDRLLAEAPDAPALSALPAGHVLRQVVPHVVELASQATPRDESVLLLAQKVVQLLYKAGSPLARDLWVHVLQALCELSVKVAREVTAWLVYAEDERKFSVPVTVALMRAHLIGVAEQDRQLAKMLLRVQFRPSAVDFAAKLVHACLEEGVAARTQLSGMLSALYRAAQVGRATPAAHALLEELEETGEPAPGGAPGGDASLREQLAYSFASWVRLYQHANNAEKTFIEYVTQLQSQNVLKGEEVSSLYFRVCTEVSVEHFFKQRAMGATSAAALFAPVDAFAKLIVFMVKYDADPAGANDAQVKVHYLTKILSIVVLVLAQSHEELGARFQQRPFFRLFSSLLHDLRAAEPSLQGVYPLALQAISNSLSTLQPLFFPGFAFAWVSLMSHRLLMPPLLLSKQPESVAAFHRLLVALLRFQAPFLRAAHLQDTTRLLFKATLRILLLLLHDFPEYLCEHHQALCDAIPTSCIQMRNLVLCAYPRALQLPDPFAPSVRLAQLPEAAQEPVVRFDFRAVFAARPGLQDALDEFGARRGAPTFLTSLREALTQPPRAGGPADAEPRYNVPLVNAVVLYVGCAALESPQNLLAGDAQHDVLLEMVSFLLHELDPEGRYLLLSGVANQLRFPSRHTAYFSALMLFLYAEASDDLVKEQILRVVLERVIVNRPHPWGLLYTLAQVLRARNVQLPKAPPEIYAILEHMSQGVVEPAAA